MKYNTDVLLEKKGNFLSIMFISNIAKDILIKDETLSKLFYLKNNVHTVDFPKDARFLIKTYLLHNELNYIEN
jgi:hypothetical protein